MPAPRLHDDGQTVTLDLHGARVDEALELTRRVLRLAARRGRHQVRLIHGASTSDVRYRNRTIRHALLDALDAGTLPHVTAAWPAEGHLLLSLDVTARPDPARLTGFDLR